MSPSPRLVTYNTDGSEMFGRNFRDELGIAVQRYLREALYAVGRIREAAETLVKVIDVFGEAVRTSTGIRSALVVSPPLPISMMYIRKPRHQISGYDV